MYSLVGEGWAGQLYLLGAYWLIKERDIMDYVGCGEPCNIDASEARKHFQIGPPHFMAAADWRAVTSAAPQGHSWIDYTLGFWHKYKVGVPYDCLHRGVPYNCLYRSVPYY